MYITCGTNHALCRMLCKHSTVRSRVQRLCRIDQELSKARASLPRQVATPTMPRCRLVAVAVCLCAATPPRDSAASSQPLAGIITAKVSSPLQARLWSPMARRRSCALARGWGLAARVG